jgi:hypothetical protein
VSLDTAACNGRKRDRRGPIIFKPGLDHNEIFNRSPYANPEAAAHKLIEIADAVEAVQDGRTSSN